jgi:transcriptional regulatory protein LEU3
MSPQTPNGSRGNPPISYVASPTSARSQNFKRPASSDDEDNGDGSGGRPGSRRSTVVKRACNECRQQKVRACVRVESVGPRTEMSALCCRTGPR